MFILVEGEVVVERQGVELGYLVKEGSFFGEGPVIDPRSSQYRSRSVMAVTDCFLICLESDAVEEVCDEWPELRARLNTFRRMGQRKPRDYAGSAAALGISSREYARRYASHAQRISRACLHVPVCLCMS